jgi:hypothetical protein
MFARARVCVPVCECACVRACVHVPLVVCVVRTWVCGVYVRVLLCICAVVSLVVVVRWRFVRANYA